MPFILIVCICYLLKFYLIYLDSLVKIVNLNHIPNLEQWLVQPCNIYIGRPCYKLKDFEHIKICYDYGNPYSVKKYERIVAIWKYIGHLIENAQILDKLAHVAEFQHKIEIGCWCLPNPCHGQILKYLINTVNT